jgi:hypothetical protein
MWTEGHIPVRVGNVTWTDLSALVCKCHLPSQVWIALRWFWIFREAMAGSLSDARIAVPSDEIEEWPENAALWNTGVDW